MIYLDNAATTLKKPPCVAEAVVRAMATMGNSGRSAHQEALDASRVIYRTREQLARLLGCSAAERVVFTCNSTEALNIAIDGLFAPGDHVLSTDCEHNSVLRPLYRLEGVEVDFLPADRRGCINYDDFRRLLRPNTRGIVCTHGSNLTGNLLDIRAIGRFSKEHGLLLVVDASQTAGVFDIDMEAMGIDVVCFTGHKSLLGPQGTGGLCIAPGVDIRPFKVGGTGVQTYLPQQPPQYPTRLEAGTLNGHGIAGLSAALDYLEETGLETIRSHEQALARQFYSSFSVPPLPQCTGAGAKKIWGHPAWQNNTITILGIILTATVGLPARISSGDLPCLLRSTLPMADFRRRDRRLDAHGVGQRGARPRSLVQLCA